MKIKLTSKLLWGIVASTVQLSVLSPHVVADQVLINAFDTDAEVYDNNGNPWDNWFGSAFYQVLWDSADASNNVSSGSMQIQAIFPPGGGSQFVVYNQNDGISPPLDGNGSTATGPVATNLQFDIRFDPITVTNAAGNFPTLEIGTRGIDYGQHNFGLLTIPASQTNWVHVNIPIGPDSAWATIPNLYFKHYSSAYSNDWVIFNVDNIVFDQSVVEIPQPTMAIEGATRGLRVFAGSTANTYDREQLTSVNTNQSWVGGSYPVSYSFELLSFPTPPSDEETVFRYHIFLVPVAYAGGNSFVNNEYIEYQAQDNLWLNVNQTSDTNGLVTLYADISWKTNHPDNNPDHEALRITNDTAVGTWTLTFNSATDGTLTAPGASPAAFSIPAEAAARFANPVVAFFGVQPDSGWGIGKYADVASIHTAGVAAPGVPINQDFTTATSIDTNVWDVSNSALPSSLVLVGSNAAYWVNWAFPDTGYGLGTKADLGDGSVPWKTPDYFTGYESNAVFQQKLGTDKVWSLVPKNALPTVDGMSNGVPSSAGYFRLSSPAPAE